MTKKVKFGAALVALAILPAAVFLFHLSLVTGLTIAFMFGPLALGTVAVTYGSFQDGGGPGGGYTGGTTAPTTSQAQVVNSIIAQVFMADTDTTATITHNFQLTAAQLAALYPWICWYVAQFTSSNVQVQPLLSFALGTNTVTITKASATSSGGTYNVIVQRPWTASN